MEEPAQNALVKWLQMLSLPLWAKILLLTISFFVLIGGFALVIWGIYRGDKEYISSALTLLTVGLPIILVVVALIFGRQDEKYLHKATKRLLSHDIPEAIRRNIRLQSHSLNIHTSQHGCIGEYVITLNHEASLIELPFHLELNVKKANLALWLNLPEPCEQLNEDSPEIAIYKHGFAGAKAEGWQMNDVPIRYVNQGQGKGVLFYRKLHDDFLLKPTDRLYFCQDVSFMIRSVLEAHIQQHENRHASSR